MGTRFTSTGGRQTCLHPTISALNRILGLFTRMFMRLGRSHGQRVRGSKGDTASQTGYLETGRGRHTSSVSSSPSSDTLHAEHLFLACMSLMQGPAARRWAGGSARGPRPTRAAPPSRWSAPWCRSACMRWGARPAPSSRAWANGSEVQGARADPLLRSPVQRLGSRGMCEICCLAGSLGARTGRQQPGSFFGWLLSRSSAACQCCVYTPAGRC